VHDGWCEQENNRHSSSCPPMQLLTVVVSYVVMEIFVRVGSHERVRATQGCFQTPGEPMSTRASKGGSMSPWWHSAIGFLSQGRSLKIHTQIKRVSFYVLTIHMHLTHY
jgi:hypothetical protein